MEALQKPGPLSLALSSLACSFSHVSSKLVSICACTWTPCGRAWLLPTAQSDILSAPSHQGPAVRPGKDFDYPFLGHLPTLWPVTIAGGIPGLATCLLLGLGSGSAPGRSTLRKLAVRQKQELPVGLGLRLGERYPRFAQSFRSILQAFVAAPLPPLNE